MDISLFLAQAFGIYFVVMGLAMLQYRKMIAMIDDFFKNVALMFVIGIFVLILGTLLILTHNVWDGTWRVAITVIAWITFLKGLAYLFLPKGFFSGVVDVFRKKEIFVSAAVVVIAIGLWLSYIGFGFGV